MASKFRQVLKTSSIFLILLGGLVLFGFAVRTELQLSKEIFSMDSEGFNYRILWLFDEPWELTSVFEERLRVEATDSKNSLNDNLVFSEIRGEFDIVNESIKGFSILPFDEQRKYGRQIGMVYLLRNQLIEAEKIFSDELKFAPSSAELHLYLGALKAVTRTEESLDHLSFYLGISGKEPNNFEKIQIFKLWKHCHEQKIFSKNSLMQALLFQMSAHIDQGLWYKARAIISKIDVSGGSNNLLLAKARFAYFIGNHDESIQIINKSFEKPGLSKANIAHLLHHYREHGDFVRMIDTLETSLKKDPSDPWIWAELKKLLLEDLGDFDRAVRVFSWAYDRSQKLELLPIIAQAYKAQGESQKALDNLKKYVAYNPSSIKIWYEIGKLQISLKQISDLNVTIKSFGPNGNLSPQYWELLGRYDFENSRFEEAIADFEKLQLFSTGNASNELIYLCHAYRVTRRFNEAVTCYRKIHSVNKNFQIAQRLGDEAEVYLLNGGGK